jgi:glutaredoxin
MINYLEAHKMSYAFVDVNKPDGDIAFKKATSGKNIRGVPYTIDHTTGEEIAGFREINL